MWLRISSFVCVAVGIYLADKPSRLLLLSFVISLKTERTLSKVPCQIRALIWQVVRLLIEHKVPILLQLCRSIYATLAFNRKRHLVFDL